MQRLIAAIGVSAIIQRPGIHLINACRTYAADSQAWADACIAYGQRRERDSQSLIGRGIGIGLQAAIHTLLGDDDAAAAVQNRETPVMEMFRDPVARDGEVLLMSDESIALEWLQHLQVYGELSAREFLRSEVHRVSKIPGYDPCPPREAQP